MATENRDFKGVWIPRVVWLDKRLNALDKVILTEIDSLDMSESGCFASNKYIADFCQCSETKVSTAISKLIDYGYITVQSFDGRTRILKSSLSNFERQIFKNCEADSQNLKDNNTYTKPKNKPLKEDMGASPRARFVPPTLEEVKAYCDERQNNVDAQKFIDYYTSNGWQVGKNKMRDWKAAVRTWERNGYDNKQPSGKSGFSSFDTDDFFNAAVSRSLTPRAALEREAAARMEASAAKSKPVSEDRLEKLKKELQIQ